MGLSFHDQESLAEAVGSLQFAVDNPNPVPGTGCISDDGHLRVRPIDPDPILVRVHISQERNDIGSSDDIEIVTG